MDGRRWLALATLIGTLTFVVARRIRRARRDPSAFAYEQRRWAEIPRPFATRARLREMLALRGDERVLEVGPGAGYYTLHTAAWLSAGGTLEILDVQQEMLDHTMRRAHEVGMDNVIPVRTDAQDLPYPDDSFDAAYLIATLGEVPDRQRVLTELRRVLKPGGRLVVGESQPDPHMIGFGTLCALFEGAGLTYERRVGGFFGYFAAFRVL